MLLDDSLEDDYGPTKSRLRSDRSKGPGSPRCQRHRSSIDLGLSSFGAWQARKTSHRPRPLPPNLRPVAAARAGQAWPPGMGPPGLTRGQPAHDTEDILRPCSHSKRCHPQGEMHSFQLRRGLRRRPRLCHTAPGEAKVLRGPAVVQPVAGRIFSTSKELPAVDVPRCRHPIR